MATTRNFDVAYSFILTPKSVLWLVLRIREVPGSNLGAETGYPEGYHGFCRYLQASGGIVPQIRPRLLPFTCF
jgi:hypothetical protein